MSRQGKWQKASNIIILVLLFIAQTAWAHGGGILQISSQPAGPYRVSVWTSPAQLETGELAHVTIGLADTDEAPVLDATIIVELISLETGQVWTAPATTEQATNKLFYEADMTLPEDGRYTLSIQIDGEQGSGIISFTMTILPPEQTNWLIISLISLGIILPLVMFRLWNKQSASPPVRQR